MTSTQAILRAAAVYINPAYSHITKHSHHGCHQPPGRLSQHAQGDGGGRHHPELAVTASSSGVQHPC